MHLPDILDEANVQKEGIIHVASDRMVPTVVQLTFR